MRDLPQEHEDLYGMMPKSVSDVYRTTRRHTSQQAHPQTPQQKVADAATPPPMSNRRSPMGRPPVRHIDFGAEENGVSNTSGAAILTAFGDCPEKTQMRRGLAEHTKNGQTIQGEADTGKRLLKEFQADQFLSLVGNMFIEGGHLLEFVFTSIHDRSSIHYHREDPTHNSIERSLITYEPDRQGGYVCRNHHEDLEGFIRKLKQKEVFDRIPKPTPKPQAQISEALGEILHLLNNTEDYGYVPSHGAFQFGQNYKFNFNITEARQHS